MAVSRNAQIALFISAGSLSGVGNTLKRMDRNNTGRDDVAGSLCSVFAEVLTAVATDELGDLQTALQLNIQTSQRLLDDLGKET